MNFDSLKLYLEILSSFITALGVPVAIFLHFKEKLRERLDREYGTYNALDDKYIEFLNLCLENTDLGIYDMSTDNEFTDEQVTRREIIFEILICLFERAFLMYKSQNTKIKHQQWMGWNAYVEDWMKNKNFRIIWSTTMNSQYDTLFLIYMNSIYNKQTLSTPSQSV